MSDPPGARVLCLDVGTRRIGVAGSDSLGITAQPLETIETRGHGDTDALDAIVDIVREREVHTIVVGLPLTMDGRGGQAVQRTRRFIETLEPRLPDGIEIVEWDERLSTVAAERALRDVGVDGRRRRDIVDGVAAALILRGWLAAQG